MPLLDAPVERLCMDDAPVRYSLAMEAALVERWRLLLSSVTSTLCRALLILSSASIKRASCFKVLLLMNCVGNALSQQRRAGLRQSVTESVTCIPPGSRFRSNVIFLQLELSLRDTPFRVNKSSIGFHPLGHGTREPDLKINMEAFAKSPFPPSSPFFL